MEITRPLIDARTTDPTPPRPPTAADHSRCVVHKRAIAYRRLGEWLPIVHVRLVIRLQECCAAVGRREHGTHLLPDGLSGRRNELGAHFVRMAQVARRGSRGSHPRAPKARMPFDADAINHAQCLGSHEGWDDSKLCRRKRTNTRVVTNHICASREQTRGIGWSGHVED